MGRFIPLRFRALTEIISRRRISASAIIFLEWGVSMAGF
jgi:hypothetical protein